MSILTNWGYKLPDLNSLDSLLPEQNFDIATGGKYHGDTRVSSALITASQAVRDYVGWHLYPSAKCELDTTFFDRRVTRVNGDLLIQLPARYVSGVTEVLIGGEAAMQFVLQPNGLLLVHACGFIRSPYTTVKVTYTAGLPDVLMPALQSPWFIPHVTVYMFSYSLLGCAFLIGVVRLFKDSDELFSAADTLVYIGVAFLTFGMLSGSIWAKAAWGHFWNWDPKETWALITWLVYLMYIHLRLYRRGSVKLLCILLIFAFACLQMCWWGINFLPSAAESVHVY